MRNATDLRLERTIGVLYTSEISPLLVLETLPLQRAKYQFQVCYCYRACIPGSDRKEIRLSSRILNVLNSDHISVFVFGYPL